MIWFTLALFVISFLLTAFLAPKPELENARPDSLDPDNFPKATEDSPVPFLLGCAKIKGPNTLWYGGFKSVPIREKVKTGLFKSKKVTVGHTYFLSMDLGLCLGPNVILRKIIIDSVEVNPGTQYYPVKLEKVFWTDLSLQFDTSSYNHEEIELTTELGITETNIGRLISVGGLKVKYSWDFSAEQTPILGGGPSSGFYDFDITFRDISSPLGDNSLGISPPEGAEAEDSQNDGSTISMNFSADVTVPVGTRWMKYGAQFSPSLVLFTFLNDTPGGQKSIVIYGEGVDVDSIDFDINEPDLYGGYKSGGGHVGNVSFYPGSFNDVVDPFVEGIVGVGNVPAYNGISHIVFKNHNIGESASLRKIEFLLCRYTDNLQNGYGGRIASGADDMDPAEAIYEILTNSWSGLDMDPSNIDMNSFLAASATLISEANGVSIIISAQIDGSKIIGEILRQIDGIIYQDSSSGKIILKLIRSDYVVDDLMIYDEDDIISVRSFNKTSWRDIRSQVKVSFNSNDTESSRVAIAQNMATANMIGGLKTSSISFPLCYSKTTANKLASRELSVLSTPLFKITVQMNRNGYALTPGEPVKISWSEFGLSEIVMRVQKIDTGELLDNKIVVDLIQDIFSVADTVFSDPEDTSWVDSRPIPETVPISSIVDMPYYFSSRLENPVQDGNGDVIPFAVQPKLASNSFDLVSGNVTGILDYTEPQQVPYPLSGELVSDYYETSGFETGTDPIGITINNLTGTLEDTPVPPVETSLSSRTGDGGILYISGEWLSYEGVTDNGGGSYTLTNIRRGLLGTRPLAHLSSSTVYFLNTDLIGEGFKSGTILEDDTLYYKFLDRIGATRKAESSEIEKSVILGDIADRPLRPRNLKINNQRIEVPFIISTDPTPSLSWVSSNRSNSEISSENDVTEVPDQTEEYDIEVWIDGIKDVGLSQTNVVSPVIVDLSIVVGVSGEFRLYSRRSVGDLKSSSNYAIYPFTLSITADTITTTVDSTNLKVDQT